MPRSVLGLLGAAALVGTLSITPVGAQPPPAEAPAGPSNLDSTSDLSVERVAGQNRYATAAEVSRQFPSHVNRVYVVGGENFPDALIAGARAGVFDAPLLMTQQNNIPAVTAEALNRLQPERIVVLGGEMSVSEAVLQELGDFAGEEGIERIAGGDRYETTAQVAGQYTKDRNRVFLASGADFPDALAAAAVAGAQHEPLLLTRPQALPSATAAQLERLNPDEVVIIGGPAAVSNSVADAAASYATSGEYRRVAGADRYRTAAAVATEFSPDLTPGYVASGSDFADALVASGIAAKRQVPVILTPADRVATGTKQALSHVDPDKIYVIGGQRAVSDAVVQELGGEQTPAPPEDPEPPTPPEDPTISAGAYNGMGESDDQAFQDLVGGVDLSHASSYYTAGEVGKNWPSIRDRERAAAGTTILMGMASKNWNRGGPNSFMAWREIAAGEHDDEIRGWGQSLAELGGPVWFAFDIEPDVKLNQGHVPSDWKPADFAAATRRISTLVRSEAPNVEFTFWVGGTQKELISEMYPGDDYVDIICWDPYVNRGRPADTTPLGLWSEFKSWLDAQPWGDGKTIGLCETGYHNGHPDSLGAEFWEQAPEAAEELGLSFVTYFHRNSGPNGNYTMENMPQSRAAYADAMAALQE